MSRCNHKNPLGFAFCVTCGEPVASSRCPRCGFACDQRFIFCGGCGCELRVTNGDVVGLSAEKTHVRYDLQAMIAQYEQETATVGANGRVNQDDIRAMLEKMQKK